MKKQMKILVTAGGTMTMIDRMRGITNIAGGRTGRRIADYFRSQNHQVTLLTSAPHIISDLHCDCPTRNSVLPKLEVIKFKTYDELLSQMRELITGHKFDVVIHSAAVSDYYVQRVCEQNDLGELITVNNHGKVSSGHETLFLQLAQTRKIVDMIKKSWKFKGVLVKFKLETGLSDGDLITVASKSAKQSGANLVVANHFESFNEKAFIVGPSGSLGKDIGFSIEVSRNNLPSTLHGLVTK